MIDQHGRGITYLRISVTDKCNLRCRYCMPEEGVCKRSHYEMMSEDEVVTAVEVAASLGIHKIRLTGGEPLVKKNIVSICRRIAAVEGIREVCLTTNGILLPQLGKQLREAGVSRLNLSLDTLNPQKYSYITRIGQLQQFEAGLKAALEAGCAALVVELVDPLPKGARSILETLDEEINRFMVEVDAALSTSNALTQITVEY